MFTIHIPDEAQRSLEYMLANGERIGTEIAELECERAAAADGALRAAINAAFRPVADGPDAAVVASHDRIAVVPQTSSNSLVVLSAPDGWVLRGPARPADGRRPEWAVLAFVLDPDEVGEQHRVIVATARGAKVADLAADARYDLHQTTEAS